MATKPTSTPRWADVGGDIVEPTSAKKDVGWVPEEKPPAQYFNWLLNLIWQWTVYLEDGIFDGNVQFLDNVDIDGDLNVDGTLDVGDKLTVTSDIEATGNIVTTAGNVNVTAGAVTASGNVSGAGIDGSDFVRTTEGDIRHAAIWKNIPIRIENGWIGTDAGGGDSAAVGVPSHAAGSAYYIGNNLGAVVNTMSFHIPLVDGDTLVGFRIVAYDNDGSGSNIEARCWNQAIGPLGTPPGSITQLGATLTTVNSANFQHLTDTSFSQAFNTANFCHITVNIDTDADIRLYAVLYRVERTSGV